MRITKQGVNPQVVLLKGKCSNCKTEVEFPPNDAQVTMKESADPRDQGLKEFHYTCPTCHQPCISYGRPS